MSPGGCRRGHSSTRVAAGAAPCVSNRFAVATLVVATLLCGIGCKAPEPGAEPAPGPTPRPELQIPEPDLQGMEPQVRQRLLETRRAVEADPQSAAAWGRFGMVTHAHELWPEALVAYRRAELLDSGDARWPYYLGDVLSVVGTDLESAASAFRRSLVLRPDYAPGHMRLGRALFAAGQSDAAATEFERALELAPDLQPARLSLAQIRLSEGELEVAAKLLEAILAKEPRHAQALTTLGLVYMRQGSRDEARAMAQRVRSAALYNLFSDPLMEPVVEEGVSSLLVWQRATAFLDNGNYEQAALGLEQVVAMRPGNADVHQQLAIAYGNLGELERVRRHLERAVSLAPDRVDALIQLVTVQLEVQDPAGAIPHLERILELAPDDPDAPWLLGRARLLTGDVRGALASFEEASQAGGEVPAWARNEWGNALAQSGRPDDALEQFRAALAAQPDNPQSLFFVGLLLEARGSIDGAVDHYCQSAGIQPNSPAQDRLRALGRRCS